MGRAGRTFGLTILTQERGIHNDDIEATLQLCGQLERGFEVVGDEFFEDGEAGVVLQECEGRFLRVFGCCLGPLVSWDSKRAWEDTTHEQIPQLDKCTRGRNNSYACVLCCAVEELAREGGGCFVAVLWTCQHRLHGWK